MINSDNFEKFKYYAKLANHYADSKNMVEYRKCRDKAEHYHQLFREEMRHGTTKA